MLHPSQSKGAGSFESAFLLASSLAGCCFSGAASESAVGSGGGGFGCGAGFASLGAEAGGHPFARTEEPFEERGEVEVGVELGEVDAVAGGGDFDGFKLGWLGVLQALRVLGGERSSADE